MPSRQELMSSKANELVYSLKVQHEYFPINVNGGVVNQNNKTINLNDIIGIKIETENKTQTVSEPKPAAGVYYKSSISYWLCTVSLLSRDEEHKISAIHFGSDKGPEINHLTTTFSDSIVPSFTIILAGRIKEGIPIRIGNITFEKNGISFDSGFIFKSNCRLSYSELKTKTHCLDLKLNVYSVMNDKNISMYFTEWNANVVTPLIELMSKKG